MGLKERAEHRFSEIEGELRAISRWMYENPEIAFEEHKSSERLAGFLGDHGFTVDYPAYGLDTAFAARVGGSGPEVVICAEYDALPGVGHACGHNIIATAALGAGVALAPLAEELNCRVTVLGTPAEEKFGGKVDLILAGAFDGASAAMIVHPAPYDVVDPFVVAVAHLDVHYRGKESHAAFAPHLGVNALDAFVQAYVNVATLRQQLQSTDKVHCIISHGGDAANVIPAYTRSTWYVRAPDRDRLDQVTAKVQACFEAAATATGCSLEIEQVGHSYDNMASDPVLVDLFAANAASLGREMMRGSALPPEAAGSTDMGNVSHVVPTIHPMLGLNSLPAVNHQPEFAAHTVTPAGEQAIRDGALGMAWTVIDVADGHLWGQLTGDKEVGKTRH
jgi:amidohydrolase